jgi:hypothetical protein
MDLIYDSDDEDNDNIKKKIYKISNDITVCDNFLSDNDFNKLREYIKNYIHGRMKVGIDHRSSEDPTTITHVKYFLDEDDFFTEYIFNKIKKTFNQNLQLKRVYMPTQVYGEEGQYHIDDDECNNYTFTLYITLPLYVDRVKYIYRDNKKDFQNNDNSFFKIKNILNNYKKYDTVINNNNNTEERKKKINQLVDDINLYNNEGHLYIGNNLYSRTCIPFIENRGCFFNSQKIHMGTSFNKDYYRRRFVISFKTYEKKTYKKNI